MEVVANVKFLDGGFMAGPEASVSGGLLDLVILKDSGSLKMLDGLNNIRQATMPAQSMLDAKARKVLVKSKDRKAIVRIDGEQIGILPATFQVPNALTVVT